MDKKTDTLTGQGGNVLFALQRLVGFNEKKEIDCCGVTMTQCLTLLAFDGTSGLLMGELSRKMQVAQSTMTRIVDPLVRDGLLKRYNDPRDRRTVRVGLTDKGKQILDRLNQCYRDFWQRIFLKVPESKRKKVVDSLEILVAALMSICEDKPITICQSQGGTYGREKR